MKTDELNDFIKHYIEMDKTQSALMLTAPWGTGKSYYINNVLVPFLNETCEKKCLIVSLYGLKDTKEISKSIFLELKMKAISKNNTGLNAGKIVAKTVVKGVASFFGVDLNVNEEDLNKLYASIDLSDKLIILEDVERSQIDILEILGFVNNLVEQDGVKVLLVTNEDEILHYEVVNDEKKKDEKIKVLDSKSLNYLKIKEKTIGDTIKFYSFNRNAVESIIGKFNDERLNSKLEIIGVDAFSLCYKLSSFLIPDSVTLIGRNAFIYDNLLENVIIGENSKLTTIGRSAFDSCKALTSIIIPQNVTLIYDSAFVRSGLKKATFKNPNGWYTSYEIDATSGVTISSEDLSTQNIAAQYLTSNYYDRYWFRS